ncbi:hypothetical protein WAX74_05255 [Psychrobacillus sp. FJAT-51614]|uniref:Lipoprotein n=1 Tax=Psychrobacillus mangrovi TaxID=3117745 RepID=A0ABU8F249_9BACI
MIKRLIFILGFSLVFALSACGDPVQDDLLNYINNEVKALEELENEAVTEYDSVIGENYVDDETTYIHIQDVVIPKYRKLIEKLEEIRPETKEVREIHELYIEASNMQFNGIVTVLAAIDAQDYDKINEANQILNEGRELMRQTLNEIEDLAKEHNVTLTDQ